MLFKLFKPLNSCSILTFPFLIFLFLNACNFDDCLNSTGKIISEERQLSFFKTISIEDVFIITIVDDSTDYLEISGGKNLIEKVKTEVIDEKLCISNNNHCNWIRNFDHKIKIVIHSKSVSEIDLEGQSDIYTSGTLKRHDLIINNNAGIAKIEMKLDCSNFHFNLNGGTGDYIFSGKAGVCFVFVEGTGFYRAENLISNVVFLSSSSTGDCFVNVKEIFAAHIFDKGNVYYYGEPQQLTSEITGKGKLIKLE